MDEMIYKRDNIKQMKVVCDKEKDIKLNKYLIK